MKLGVGMFGYALANPVFLYALAALSVPVIIHLLFKSRRNVSPFSSVVFIVKSAVVKSRRMRFRELILFLLRFLAFSFIILAFAQPYKKGSSQSGGLRERKAIIVLIDNAFPMSRRTDRGMLFEEAKALAEKMLGEGGQFAALPVCNPDHSWGGWTSSLSVVRHAISEMKISGECPAYAEAITRCAAFFALSDAPAKELLLVCSAQASRWSDVRDVLPSGVGFRCITIGDEAPNLAITSVRKALAGDEKGFQVEIANFSPTPQKTVLKCLSDESEIATVPSELRPWQKVSVAVDVDPGKLAGGTGRFVVSGTDSLDADDSRWFSLSAGKPVSVLCVEERLSPSLSDQQTYYIRMALEPDPASPGRGTRCWTESDESAKLDEKRLTGVDVLVLSDITGLTPNQTRAIEQFVSAGGGVAIFGGPAMNASIWNANAWRNGAGFLPLAIKETGRAISESDKRYISELDSSNSLLSAFGRESRGALSVPEFSLWMRADVGDARGTRVMARFDNGDPAIVGKDFGRGKVVFFTFPCDNRFSDLPRRMAFVPLVNETIAGLAGQGWRRSREAICGAPIVMRRSEFPQAVESSARGVLVNLPSGERQYIGFGEKGDAEFKGTVMPGIYALKLCGDSEIPIQDVPALNIPVNLDPAGSDQRRAGDIARFVIPPKMIDTIIPGERQDSVNSGGQAGRALLVAALCLLGAEMVIANRLRL